MPLPKVYDQSGRTAETTQNKSLSHSMYVLAQNVWQCITQRNITSRLIRNLLKVSSLTLIGVSIFSVNPAFSEWSGSSFSTTFRGPDPSALCKQIITHHAGGSGTDATNCTYTDSFTGLSDYPNGTGYYCNVRRKYAPCPYYGPNGYQYSWKMSVHYSEGYYVSGEELNLTCDREGNPCDVVTGRKTEMVIDYQDSELEFARHYDSGAIDPDSRNGIGWRHIYDVRLDRYSPIASGPTNTLPPTRTQLSENRSRSYNSRKDACLQGWESIRVTFRNGTLSANSSSWESDQCLIKGNGGETLARVPVFPDSALGNVRAKLNTSTKNVSLPNGTVFTFRKRTGTEDTWEPVGGHAVSLTQEGTDNFTFTDTSATRYKFYKHRLVEMIHPNSRRLTINWSEEVEGVITSISSDSGKSLALSYNDDFMLSSVLTPNGNIRYDYNQNYNLTSVTYEDNSSLKYHYENADFPNHLTGYTDQKGVRFATWKYDGEGRAISSEHAEGAEKTTLQFLTDQTIVTTASGAKRIYEIDNLGGRRVVTGVSGDHCLRCKNGDFRSRTYDAFGRISAATDWNGNITTFDYNDRGLEIVRTEASGTPEQRIVSTVWHPTLNLPIEIIGPASITSFSYDSEGRPLSRTVQPAQQ